MLRKKISLLLAAVMVTGATAAAIPSIDAYAVTEGVSAEEVSYDPAVLEQLTYAIEEMRIAVTCLEENSADANYILTFAATAIERLRGLDLEEVDKIPHGTDNYWWVATTYNRVLSALTPAGEGEGDNAVVMPGEDYTEIPGIGDVIGPVDPGFTVDPLPEIPGIGDIIGPVDPDFSVDPLPEYDPAVLEQLTYAIEEMRIAITCLEENSADANYILTFAATAIERLRGLDLEEVDKIPHGTDNYWWVANTYNRILIALTPAAEGEGDNPVVMPGEDYTDIPGIGDVIGPVDPGFTVDPELEFPPAAEGEGDNPVVMPGEDYTDIPGIGDITGPVDPDFSVDPLPEYDEAVLAQLTYAVEEMRIAVTELENGSTDFERILTFAATAIERLRYMDREEVDKIPNGTDNLSWVLTTYNHVVNTIASTPQPL